MNMGDRIFEALTDVGTDLVDMAEHERFAKPLWRRIFPLAACAAMIIGLGIAANRYLPELQHRGTPTPENPTPVEVLPDPEQEQEPETPVPAVIPQELPSLPFYIYDPDPDSTDTPSKAIAPDGTVLVEVESGEIQPLIDEKTGEYVSILVSHGTNEKNIWLEVYDLDGTLVTPHLTAYETRILGDFQLYNAYVDGEFTASLYNRRENKWLPVVHEQMYIMGDVIVAYPIEDQMAWVYDSAGFSRQLPQEVLTYLLEDNRFTLIVGDGTGRYGLEDPFGTALTPCSYTSIVSARNGYAHCEDESGHYAVDTTTGEVVFSWTDDILEVWETHVLAQKDGHCVLLTRDGIVTAEANAISVLDDDNDKRPDLFHLIDGNTHTFLDRNAMTTDVFTTDGIVEPISSRAAAVITEDGFAILNWAQGQTLTEFDRHYTSVQVIPDTGLFFAAHDGGIDLLREDGTVVLENIRDFSGRQGDVFFCVEDGRQGLKRTDGSWLYSETR